MNQFIEKRFETDIMPKIGDRRVCGEYLFVQATGVRIKRQAITNQCFFALDKRFFIAKDAKGNLLSCKIVGPYL